MRTYAWVIFILLVSACKEPPKYLDKLPDDAVILAFGDSLTYGTGASANHDYPSILASLTHREVINEGVPGEISADGLKRLPALFDEYRPQLLILIHGGNDILKKIPSQTTAGNIAAMMAAAKSRNIKVLLLGVPEPGLLLMESAPFYKIVAEQSGVPTDLDTLPDVLGKNELKSDLIHPNDAGYGKIAGNIYQFLKESGAI